MERISDHCSNIATNTIQSMNVSVPKHTLKNQLKEADIGEFSTKVEEFRQKYAVEPITA